MKEAYVKGSGELFKRTRTIDKSLEESGKIPVGTADITFTGILKKSVECLR